MVSKVGYCHRRTGLVIAPIRGYSPVFWEITDPIDTMYMKELSWRIFSLIFVDCLGEIEAG